MRACSTSAVGSCARCSYPIVLPSLPLPQCSTMLQRSSAHTPSTRALPRTSVPALTMCCRFCTTRTSATMTASSTSSSTHQAPPPQGQLPRRSKRLSYADADRVYAATDDLAGLGSSAREAANLHRTTCLSSHPSSQEMRQQQQQQQHRRFLNSIRTRVEQQWQTTVLTLLRMPYVGALVVRLLELSAYAAYVKGSVVLFTRMPAGPPLHDASRTEAVRTSQRHSSTAEQNPEAATPSTPRHTGDSTLLHAHVLPCLYIGQSSIHSRGLLTATALPKGTRIIAEPHRSLLLAAHFLTLLADTHEKLPDTWHYSQPTGSVVELVAQAQPHHLMNHSCRANVCSGLSPIFWDAARLAAELQSQRLRRLGEKGTQLDPRSHREGDLISLHERLTQWPHFADANSFFLTRDVAAGEELTLNYSTRMAPLYAGEARHGVRAQGWLLCRCGEPCCRHYVYRRSPEAATFLQELRLHGGASRHKTAAAAAAQHEQQQQGTCDVRDGELNVKNPLWVTARLLELGFDDELVLLTYGARPADVVAYVYGEPLPSFCVDGTAARTGVEMKRRRISKRELLLSYRHVFRVLNEAVPQSVRASRSTCESEKAGERVKSVEDE